MKPPKAPFENYEPTEAQAAKIEEVTSAYKFLYKVLVGLAAKEYPRAQGYLSKAVDALDASWTLAKKAIIYNDAEPETKEAA